MRNPPGDPCSCLVATVRRAACHIPRFFPPAWALLWALLVSGLGVPATQGAGGSLVAHWRFDESAGGLAADATGFFPGTLSPSGASFVSGGISGNALALNRAESGYVDFGNVLENLGVPYSLVVWFQLPVGDVTPVAALLAKHRPGFENGYYIVVNDFPNTISAYSGNLPFLGTAVPVNDGNWHQVVLTYDPVGAVTLYLDGVIVDARTSASPVLPSPARTVIGGVDPGNPLGTYTGRLDEIQMYDYALTATDVSWLRTHPGGVVGEAPPEIQIIPNGGNFYGQIEFTLRTGVTGGTIHYTTDGTPPKLTSPTYSGPVTLADTTTVKAKVFVGSQGSSKLKQAKFTEVSRPEPRGVLVGHWTFDQSGGTTVPDAVGDYPGTLSPTGAGFEAGGVFGNALALHRAQNGYVDLGDVLPNQSVSYSISAWFKLPVEDTTPVGAIFAKHWPGFENGYWIAVNDFPNTLSAYSGNVPFLSTTETLNDGAWHHVVLSYDLAGAVRLYVDGSPADASAVSSPVLSSPARTLIGGTAPGTPQGTFEGWIDEVQYYDFALNDGEVDYLRAHPAQTLGVQGPPLQVLPPGGTFDSSVTVKLKSGIVGGEIRYTTDGSPPKSSSPRYLGPLGFTNRTQLKARVFLAGKVASQTESAKFVPAPLPARHGQLLAHWRFDQSTSPLVPDVTGNYPGTLSPSGAEFVSDGVSGNALALYRPENGYVALGDVLPSQSATHSICAWFRLPPGDTTPVAAILAKHRPGYENGYYLIVNDFPNSLTAYAGLGTALGTTKPVNDGAWHHVSLAYDAANATRLFLDGVLVDTRIAAGGVITSPAQLVIGGVDPGAPLGTFNGSIDEVQFYDFALTGSEAAYLAATPGAQLGVPIPSLRIEPAGGEFYGSVTVTLKSTIPGGDIRYTTNQQAPKVDSPLYTTPLILTNQQGSYSVSAWFRLPLGDVTPVAAIFAKHRPGFENGYYLVVNDFPNTVTAFASAGTYLGATTPINDGQWHRVVLSYDSAGLARLYLDGGPPAASGPASTVLGSPGQAVLGGVDPGPVQGTFNGALDEVEVYDFPLNDSEVEYLRLHPGGELGF